MVTSALREKLRMIDTTISLFDTGPLEKAIGSSFDNRQAVMLLLVAFAGLALFLSALGIYSVLAYDVSQRTREIGIRGAVGATREQIVMMIIKQGLWKVGIGLVAGLIAAAVLSRYMTSLLFAVKPSDPVGPYRRIPLALGGRPVGELPACTTRGQDRPDGSATG